MISAAALHTLRLERGVEEYENYGQQSQFRASASAHVLCFLSVQVMSLSEVSGVCQMSDQ